MTQQAATLSRVNTVTRMHGGAGAISSEVHSQSQPRACTVEGANTSVESHTVQYVGVCNASLRRSQGASTSARAPAAINDNSLLTLHADRNTSCTIPLNFTNCQLHNSSAMITCNIQGRQSPAKKMSVAVGGQTLRDGTHTQLIHNPKCARSENSHSASTSQK